MGSNITTSDTGFYLTIPSDKSDPENTLSSFRVKLARTIDLDGRWECALVSLNYPISHTTLHGGRLYLHTYGNVRYQKLAEPFHYKNAPMYLKTITDIRIPDNHYSTPEALVKTLNGLYQNMWIRIKNISLRELPETPDNPEHRIDDLKKLMYMINEAAKGLRFFYDAATMRVSVFHRTGPLTHVELDETLSYALGFTHRVTGHGQHQATYPPDPTGGIKHLFTYLNIIEPQIVGNKMTPLLKIINIRGKYGEEIEASFYHLHYCNVLVNQFESLEISIKDISGRPLKFAFGSVIVKLHFRRKSIF
jgi:hypothetical protein